MAGRPIKTHLCVASGIRAVRKGKNSAMRVDDYGALGSDQPLILPVIAKNFGERLAEKRKTLQSKRNRDQFS